MFGNFLTWEVLSLGLTGLAIVALGGWVFFLKPGDERHRAFGLYLFLYGAADIGQALPVVELRDVNAMDMVAEITLLAAAWALAWFVLVYPRQRFSRATRRLGLAAFGVVLATLVLAMLVRHDSGAGVAPDGNDVYTPISALTMIWVAALAAAPLVFSLDLLRGGNDDSRGLKLVAIAGIVWPLYDATNTVLNMILPSDAVVHGEEWLLARRLLRLGFYLLAVAACVNLARYTKRQREPLLPLIGVLLSGPLIAIARRLLDVDRTLWLVDLAVPVLVTLAILRGRLFGLDIKLRFAISRSTIAAAFVAAFFLASEGAQLVLGRENAYVGLVGAAALVFAMAPLQRAAERLAEKAVPISASPAVAASEPMGDTRAVSAYRAAVRAALRDGGITRREELHLMEVAEHVGLTPRQAAVLRHEVEDESVRGGA